MAAKKKGAKKSAKKKVAKKKGGAKRKPNAAFMKPMPEMVHGQLHRSHKSSGATSAEPQDSKNRRMFANLKAVFGGGTGLDVRMTKLVSKHLK
jgi:hypothetical protein